MIDIDGLFFPPLFIAIIIAAIIVLLISILINYFGLYKYVWHPAFFYAALAAIITMILLLTGIVPS